MLKPISVQITTADGCTHVRKFAPARNDRRSQQLFNEWALGSLIAMVTTGFSDSLNLDGNLWISAGSFDKESAAVTSWEVVVLNGIERPAHHTEV